MEHSSFVPSGVKERNKVTAADGDRRPKPRPVAALSSPLIGILDPAVIDGCQRFDQAVLDRSQVHQRQAAFVELAIQQLFHGDVFEMS